MARLRVFLEPDGDTACYEELRDTPERDIGMGFKSSISKPEEVSWTDHRDDETDSG